MRLQFEHVSLMRCSCDICRDSIPCMFLNRKNTLEFSLAVIYSIFGIASVAEWSIAPGCRPGALAATGVRIPPGAPKLTCSELTAPRGEYAALRRAKSAFVFAVKSQSSPQLIESVLSLISGLEPRERKKLRQSA